MKKVESFEFSSFTCELLHPRPAFVTNSIVVIRNRIIPMSRSSPCRLFQEPLMGKVISGYFLEARKWSETNGMCCNSTVTDLLQ